ncbi:MAG: hypothetical protein JJ979_21420 [Roseibium sp.]|nr:hypothetical protein [Roseibium sp.]
MASVGFHKVVSTLPDPLEANAVYYVRAGAGYDMYVTNSSGTIIAYGANVPAHNHDWSEITGKPGAFTPTAHTHAWGDLTGTLPANLDLTGNTLYGLGKSIVKYDDSWLRLNQGLQFTSGVYTPGNLRVDGMLEVQRNSTEQIRLGYGIDQSVYISFYRGTTRRGFIQAASGFLKIQNDVTDDYLYLDNVNSVNALKWYDKSLSTHHTIWHSGNDGAGSGLQADNADKVDNLHASSFIRADADDNVTGTTEWQDNKEIRMGNSADWRQFHNGSHTYLRNYTGNIYIESYAHAAEWLFRGEDSGGVMNNLIVLQDNLYCRFYHDNSEKMRTDGSGVTVYGRLHADDMLYVGRNGGGDSWVQFYDDNSNTWRYLGWDDSANSFVFEHDDGVLRNLGQAISGHWTRYNGTNNSTVDSYNQSSLTDLGTGRHRSSIGSDFNNANFSVAASATQNFNGSVGWAEKIYGMTAGQVQCSTGSDGSTNASWADNAFVTLQSQGDI